jgi:hypothetical protein
MYDYSLKVGFNFNIFILLNKYSERFYFCNIVAKVSKNIVFFIVIIFLIIKAAMIFNLIFIYIPYLFININNLLNLI